jgi:hypothetical protein
MISMMRMEECKFGGDGEIVLAIAEFDEYIGPADDHQEQTDQIGFDYLHEENQHYLFHFAHEFLYRQCASRQ